jgi:hypothetical protein
MRLYVEVLFHEGWRTKRRPEEVNPVNFWSSRPGRVIIKGIVILKGSEATVWDVMES